MPVASSARWTRTEDGRRNISAERRDELADVGEVRAHWYLQDEPVRKHRFHRGARHSGCRAGRAVERTNSTGKITGGDSSLDSRRNL